MDGNRCDWAKAHAAGIRFCYLRAAFSTMPDPTYANEAVKARAAGVKPGPYFFPDERIGAIAMSTQIAAFAAIVKAHEQPGDLPAAFDVEYAKGTRATGRSRAQLLALIVEIAAELRAALGYSPVLYSSKRVIDGDDTDTLDATHAGVDLSPLKACPFWASRYVTDYRKAPILNVTGLPPIPAYLGDARNVWFRQTQGDSVGLAGFTSTVDIDVFYPMQQGETGERVRWVQRLVQAEGTPGVFDAAMVEAVKAFQAAQGLDADAIIGLDTWCRLAKLNAAS